ncbi:hypothetical protein [Orlajensenia flava]|nr:hypothetical protein [Glaciibacter flavus]
MLCSAAVLGRRIEYRPMTVAEQTEQFVGFGMSAGVAGMNA